jgi:hypothetical protein
MAANLEKKQKMFSIIESWESGSDSQQAFCKKAGIALSGFQYWLRKYRDEKDSNQSSSFIPVKIQSGTSGSAFAELVLPDGRRLTLYQAVDVSFLRSLLS